MTPRHLAGRAVSLLLRGVPRRFRFGAAMVVAAAATPILRRHPFVRERMRTRVETARDIVTYHLLQTLTQRGVAFDPALRTVGAERFESALASGRGVLIVGVHSMLSTLALRALRDMGTDAVAVSRVPVLIPGSGVPARIVEPSFTYLLEVRRLLRANEIVVAMVDRGATASRTAVAVTTAQGEMVIVDALIQLAVRAEASIVFTATRLIGREFVITHGAPTTEELRSAQAVTAAFIEFLKQRVEEVGRL